MKRALTLLAAAFLAVTPPAHASKSRAHAASATATASTPAEAPADGTTVISKTFADLGAGREPVRLSSWSAGYTLKLPLSPREVVTGAHVTLETANSTALIKSRSELAVRVNGRMLAQYPLDPVDTVKTREIDIPASLLKAGYNEVLFNVVQHYTYDCEDPSSPELWTEINTLHSGVSMGFAGLKPNLEPRLSQLGIAFDRRGWMPRPLAVVAGTEHISEVQMAAASLVVQGLALRMGYRPMDVDVYGASTGAAMRPEPTKFPGLSSAVVKGRDVLLVGRRAELSRYLDPELHALMNAGPFVGVFSAQQGDSVILVVSGNTDQELMTAARSLAEPKFKFSDVPMETIKDQWAFEKQPVAAASEKAPFSKFDFRTTGARGMRMQPVYFEFRAPADYGAKKGDLVSVMLHFSYGAGLRKDSSMVVKLNDQFAVSVPLSEAAGAEFQKYEVRVPAQFVRPGYNTLTFEPVMIAHRERCETPRDEGLVLTIYEDSTFELPGATVAPKAPDLARFAGGFWPMQDSMRMYLTSADTQTAAAALTFSASMAQKNRAPFEVELKYSPFESGHMLAIGPDGALEDFVAKALPLRRYTWSAEGSQVGLLQGIEGKRVITAFLAHDSAALKRGVRVMDDKGMWKGVTGQAAIIDTTEQTMVTEPATAEVDFGTVSNLSVSVGNWKMMAALALGLSAIFALAFVAALRRTADKRRQAASGKSDG